MASSSPESELEDDTLFRIGQACEAHLEACMDSEFLDLEGTGESPALWPFCGCTTCTVREVLLIAWPLFLKSMDMEKEK